MLCVKWRFDFFGIFLVEKYVGTRNTCRQNTFVANAETLGVMFCNLCRRNNCPVIHSVVNIGLKRTADFAETRIAESFKSTAGMPKLPKLCFVAFFNSVCKSEIIVDNNNSWCCVKLIKPFNVFILKMTVWIGEKEKLKINILIVLQLVINKFQITGEIVSSAGNKGNSVFNNRLFAKFVVSDSAKWI